VCGRCRKAWGARSPVPDGGVRPDPPPLRRQPCGPRTPASQAQNRERLGRQLAQRSLVIRVVAGIEDLHPRVVFAIKRGHRIGTACLGRVVGGVEPQPEMEGVHRTGRGIGGGIGNRVMVEHGGGRGTRRDNEGLGVEASRKIADPIAMVIGFNIALVPGQAEGGFRDLDDKEVKIGTLNL
jgi:hypothetical protein